MVGPARLASSGLASSKVEVSEIHVMGGIIILVHSRSKLCFWSYKFLLTRLYHRYIRKTLLYEVKQAPVFTVLADEPVDASTKRQRPIILCRNGTLKAKAPEDLDVVSYHSDWWKEVLEMEEKAGVEPPTPWVCVRQTMRTNSRAATPEDNFADQ